MQKKVDFDFEKVDRTNTCSLKWDVKDGELPMWVADMDFAAAPCIIDALKKRVSRRVFGYNIVPKEWYDAYINRWLIHGLEIKSEWLCFTTGVVPAISSIVKRVTNVGDNVAVMTPVYDIFFHSIENAGRHTAECPLSYDGENYEIDFKLLESILSDRLTTLLILCNPHNPVGKIWNRNELRKIGELCEKYGVTVISDEIHCDITCGKRYTPFASVDEVCKNISITCISASKAFNIAGLQSAAVVVPNEILRNNVVRGLNSDEVAEPNSFAVTATIAALNEGQEWLSALNDRIADNKRTAYAFLDKLGVKTVRGDATYLLWIDCSSFTNDTDEFCDFLRRQTGLYISKGSEYRGNGKLFVRMNVACPSSTLMDGLERFAKGLNLYKNRRLPE